MKTTNYTDGELREYANTIYKQLFISIDKYVYWSWGVSKRYYAEYEGMPTLMLRVSGAVHKGWVYISLNQGKDLYEVRTLNVRKVVKQTVTDCYDDNIGLIVDGLVERPSSWTDEQYKKHANADTQHKWRTA